KPQYDESVILKAGAYSPSKAAVTLREIVKTGENKSASGRSSTLLIYLEGSILYVN
ncbi:hypothetical protein AVEN_256156-1, partial [Araneus ventricosus]